MSPVRDWLADLKQKEVQLWVEGEQLRCSAPRGTLTPTLVAQLQQHKAELITFLRQSTALRPPAAIRPLDRAGALPLSFAQQRLWFLDQLGYGKAYHTGFAVKLAGPLTIAALQQALDAIVQRHEILRTTFAQRDGEPQQVTHAPQPVTLALTDLRMLAAADQTAAVQHVLAAEQQQSFDLTRDPMLRACLVQIGAAEAILLLTLHHIAADGWSMDVLARELSELYAACVESRPASLPDLPIQYADFAVWQRAWLQGAVLEEQLRYWRHQLADAPPLLNLSIASTRPAAPAESLRGQNLKFSLTTELTQGLRRLGRQAGTTLFMTLLAAFQILLARYSNQDDLVVGTPVANRTHKATEELIGFFVNTLPLRAQLAGNPTVLEVLAQVRQTTLAAYEHQDVPFERLVEELRMARSADRNPLVQVLFTLQNTFQGQFTLPGLKASLLPPAVTTARLDLEVDIIEVEDYLEGWWVYNADRFDAAAMQRMVGHFQTLLAGMVENPSRRVGDLPLLTPAERRQILVEWNATAADYPSDKCIQQLFEEQAARTPDAIAVVFATEVTSSLTYRDLDTRANQLAHHLQALGVGPETLVAICVEHSLEMVVGILGILKAGGAYVPLDPAYPQARLESILQDTQTPVLLTQAQLVADLPAQQARVICLDTDWDTIAAQPVTQPTSSVAPHHLAYVIYTSGSTGQPKGVLIEQEPLVAHCTHYRRCYGLTPADRVLQLAAPHFDASVEQLFPALLAGAQLILPAWELDPASFSRHLQAFGVTLLDVAGVHWRALVQAWIEQPALVAASPLRAVIVGGDVMPADVMRLWRQTPVSRTARLFNVYGPTEITVAATRFEVLPDFDGGCPRIPIGKPLANRQVYVLDPHCQPVPVGIPGELYIGGIGPARGYWRQPELTQAKFISLDELPLALPGRDTQATARRVYKTGDRVRWLPDGNLDFLGRIDNQIKLHGYRIELGEIETQLKRLPAIQDAVVIVYEEHNHPMLVGYVVANAVAAVAADLSSAALRQALRSRLPDYMLPSQFIVVDEIPRLRTSGKVDQAALPGPDQARCVAEWVAPRTPTETTLVAIWSAVLGRRQIGVDDNFFELGGHSLLATQVISRINKTFAIKLPLQRLFDCATVAALAEAVESFALARQAFVSQRSVANGLTVNDAYDPAKEEGEL